MNDHTTTNHQKRCEITNTKSNSHNICPSNAITASEINTKSKKNDKNCSWKTIIRQHYGAL